ncbi:hypothetical protein, partial [Ectopseudomonas mendocina]
VTDAITIQNPRNRGGSTGHVLAKRSVTFTEIRSRSTLSRSGFSASASADSNGIGFSHALSSNAASSNDIFFIKRSPSVMSDPAATLGFPPDSPVR